MCTLLRLDGFVARDDDKCSGEPVNDLTTTSIPTVTNPLQRHLCPTMPALSSSLVEIFRALLLFSSLSSAISNDRPEIFNIAAVLSRPSSEVNDSLKMAEQEVALREVLPPERATLHTRPYVLGNFSTSFYNSLISFCGFVQAGNVSMVIVVDNMGENSWTIPWMGSMLGLPVSLAHRSPRSATQGVRIHQLVLMFFFLSGHF